MLRSSLVVILLQIRKNLGPNNRGPIRAKSKPKRAAHLHIDSSGCNRDEKLFWLACGNSANL
jgi:hypothetical protein